MFNIENLLGNFGVISALAIIGILTFAECAFLIGLFVPGGDTLLLVAGVFAAQGDLPLAGVLMVIFVTSAAGYEVGYYIGKRTGPQIFNQKKGMLFRKEYAERVAGFYERHGGKTVFFVRFLVYARTVAPLLAGIAGMRRSKFTLYNIFGALLWTISLVMLGYWFGSAFTAELRRYSLPLIIVGLVLLCSPTIIYSIRGRRRLAK